MTNQDTLKIAEAVGLLPGYEVYEGDIIHFAALVAAAAKAEEREACAKVCEKISDDQWALYKGLAPYTGKESGRADLYTHGAHGGAEMCAEAIRARQSL